MLRPEPVQAQVGDDLRQPRFRHLDPLPVGGLPAQERVLHGVLGVGGGAEHPVAVRPQLGQVRVEVALERPAGAGRDVDPEVHAPYDSPGPRSSSVAAAIATSRSGLFTSGRGSSTSSTHSCFLLHQVR